MKRTKSINLGRMRKTTDRLSLKPISLAIASITLAACSDTRQASVFRDANECSFQNPGLEEECQIAYEEALKDASDTAPKYQSRRECEAEFGNNACTNYNASSGSMFMPAMAGFMFARALDRNRYNHSPVFTSYNSRSPFYGDWVTADGYRYGSNRHSTITVGNKAFKPKPKVTRTMSRGGFGSTVSAKSSWGGKKSSFKGGWGG